MKVKVAPTPFRAFEAEQLIEGKVMSESLAERAAKAAICDAVPLTHNAHKVSITKSLVKRALLS